MPYTLTLTREERKAIDWIGGHYRHGTELASILIVKCFWDDGEGCLTDWESPYDIKFSMPEHVAWEIKDIIDENNGALECFDRELVKKLYKFCDQIV